MSVSNKTRKLLWGRSGNHCAFCLQELVMDATVADDDSIVGDESHIIAWIQLVSARNDRLERKASCVKSKVHLADQPGMNGAISTSTQIRPLGVSCIRSYGIRNPIVSALSTKSGGESFVTGWLATSARRSWTSGPGLATGKRIPWWVTAASAIW